MNQKEIEKLAASLRSTHYQLIAKLTGEKYPVSFEDKIELLRKAFRHNKQSSNNKINYNLGRILCSILRNT